MNTTRLWFRCRGLHIWEFSKDTVRRIRRGLWLRGQRRLFRPYAPGILLRYGFPAVKDRGVIEAIRRSGFGRSHNYGSHDFFAMPTFGSQLGAAGSASERCVRSAGPVSAVLSKPFRRAKSGERSREIRLELRACWRSRRSDPKGFSWMRGARTDRKRSRARSAGMAW